MDQRLPDDWPQPSCHVTPMHAGRGLAVLPHPCSPQSAKPIPTERALPSPQPMASPADWDPLNSAFSSIRRSRTSRVRRHQSSSFKISQAVLRPHFVAMYRMAATATPYSQPKFSEDSSAPRRGFMSSSTAQLPGTAAAVSSPRSRHELPSAEDAATRARFGSPAGGRRRPGRRGCPDASHAVRPSVRVLCPLCGRPSNWSGGRPVSRRPVSTRLVRFGCPDGQASGVRGLCIRSDVLLWSASGLVVAA
jgi:hypothetical protein